MKQIIIDMKLVFVAILLAMLTQTLTSGIAFYEMWDSFIAMSLVVFISLVVKFYLPSSLPAFAYATIIGIIICLPDTPVRYFFIDSIGKVSFLSCCVPLLAFAGLSVGGQLEELKKMSWKVILIFMIVSTCCFFGASIVAQIGFSIQGVI
ncbi:hypothetical protein DC083_09775 [Ignatzschineria ureiclastica]|uniref:DUF340 domain-containing protein n=1 Tax=Ignatzschineria ureiclastica TaxID=472582 RepID=A0A2U2ACB6_9GAMM|nr:hypothetical protein [Ignatzschineria ureiclastica]PWD80301.1 hypothetical protein DC083_09775 [Ignatzschineria ureiclastica]GHA02829.1 hypothetical protein GCM10007162_18920 [Ignatzschineria ureiclastica]